MKILIAGDFCDSYRVSSMINNKNYAKIFDEIKPAIEESDFRILNFEFPVTSSEGKPILKFGPNLKGQSLSIEAIKYAGFNVCTLANNHILDQGTQCCINTKSLLEKAGIQTVGAGSNLEEAGKTLYLEKNGQTIAIINCCENEFSIATDNSAGANPLNPVHQYKKIQEASRIADRVLVIVHGGHEQYQLPSVRMKELYHFFIDCGADSVINHHQHCYSGFENYKGKPIFYGLGNLCFDTYPVRDHTSWNYGYMVALTLGRSIDFKLIPYHQMGTSSTIELQTDGTFDKALQDLNATIANDKLLKKAQDEYYASCEKFEQLCLEPYRGRFMEKLFDLGLLPGMIKGKKAAFILNHVDCESHRDKLIYALKKKLQ